MFGIVEIPVIPIAAAAQAWGVRDLGFRNEQAAGCAAGAVVYPTGRPGARPAVFGPG